MRVLQGGPLFHTDHELNRACAILAEYEQIKRRGREKDRLMTEAIEDILKEGEDD